MNNVSFADILFILLVCGVTFFCIWLAERDKKDKSQDDQ